jgi:hypothetical protein
VIYGSYRKYYKRDTNTEMNGMIFDDDQINRLINSIRSKERKISEFSHNNYGERNVVPNSYFKNEIRSFDVIHENNTMPNFKDTMNRSQVSGGNTGSNKYYLKKGNHFYSQERAVPISNAFSNKSFEFKSISPKRNNR